MTILLHLLTLFVLLSEPAIIYIDEYASLVCWFRPGSIVYYDRDGYTQVDCDLLKQEGQALPLVSNPIYTYLYGTEHHIHCPLDPWGRLATQTVTQTSNLVTIHCEQLPDLDDPPLATIKHTYLPIMIN